MVRRSALAGFTLLITLTIARAQHALDADQSQLIEEARKVAISYSQRLPDFICNQIVHRSEDANGTNRWRQIDTLNIKLNYSGHKEDYKLVEINGRPTLLDYMFVGGAISTGEFGSRLAAIFSRSSKAVFAWKGLSRVHKRKVAVFTYHIAQEHSTYIVQLGPAPVGPGVAVTAYHGEITVDLETKNVLRLTLIGEPPPRFPINECNSWIEYDYRKVAGNEYLVPVASHTSLGSGRYHAANEIEFRDYRKFQTDASISFDTGKK
jgi:hypothetical protein